MGKLNFTNSYISVQNIFSLPLTRTTFMRHFCGTKYVNNLKRFGQSERYNSTVTTSKQTSASAKFSNLVPHKNALTIPTSINQQGISAKF
jgi:hypothetical protein